MTAITADRNLIAHDFSTTYHGRMPQDQIDGAVEAILTAQSSYPISNGSIIGGIFYTRITCDITVDGKSYAFVGNGGGLFTAGGGALLGDVYTDDALRLVPTTVSFPIQATPGYVQLNFFYDSSKLLRQLQSWAVRIVGG